VRGPMAADLAEHGARLRHDVGDAETAADLDKLAARDDRLAAGGQSRQDQQRRGGVVVGDDSGFGAGEPGEQGVGVHVS
jgi:hypothetical protein